jgi:hypothetical protein
VIGCHIKFWEFAGVTSLFWLCMHQVRREVMIKRQLLWGIRAGVWLFSEVPYENSVRRFQYKGGKRECIQIGNENLHQDSNDNCVRIVNFATPKNLVVKSMMFPHWNIHKYTRTSPEGKTQNQIEHVLIDKRWDSSIPDVRSFRGAVLQVTMWWLQRLGEDWQ